jgi:hypothetical protein
MRKQREAHEHGGSAPGAGRDDERGGDTLDLEHQDDLSASSRAGKNR